MSDHDQWASFHSRHIKCIIYFLAAAIKVR